MGLRAQRRPRIPLNLCGHHTSATLHYSGGGRRRLAGVGSCPHHRHPPTLCGHASTPCTPCKTAKFRVAPLCDHVTTVTLVTRHSPVTLVTYYSLVTLFSFFSLSPPNHSICRSCPLWAPICNSGAPPARPLPAKSPAKVRNQILTIGLHNTLHNSGDAQDARDCIRPSEIGCSRSDDYAAARES